MVVVTSIRAARARLRYESWHLHPPLRLPRRRARAAAPAVDRAAVHLLARPHGLLVDGVGGRRRARCWCGGSALPLWRNLRHGLRVTSVVPEGRGVVSVYLTGRGLRPAPVPRPASSSPGGSWAGRAGPAPTRTRCPRPPTAGRLRITVADAGDGSAAVAGLRPGTRVLVEGPYGRLSDRARTRQGRAVRRGRRHHAAARAGRGLGVRARRRGAAPALHRRAPVPARARVPGRTSAACTSLELPGRRRGADSWLGDRRPPAGGADDVDRPAVLGARPGRARRLRLRPARVDRLRRRATCCAAGLPADQLHLETFAW